MCSEVNGWGWGGVMAVVNMAVKVVAALQIYAISDTFGTYAAQPGAMRTEHHGDDSPGLQAASVSHAHLALPSMYDCARTMRNTCQLGGAVSILRRAAITAHEAARG